MQENKVKIKVFAELKDIIGENSLIISIEKNLSLLAFLKSQIHDFPVFAEIINQINKKYKLYLNGNLIENLNLEIKSKDELIILPPVGGG